MSENLEFLKIMEFVSQKCSFFRYVPPLQYPRIAVIAQLYVLYPVLVVYILPQSSVIFSCKELINCCIHQFSQPTKTLTLTSSTVRLCVDLFDKLLTCIRNLICSPRTKACFSKRVSIIIGPWAQQKQQSCFSSWYWMGYWKRIC